jgi:predicted phosphodiesterase
MPITKKTLDDLLKGDTSAAQILELRQQLRRMAEARSSVEINIGAKAPAFRFGALSCTHFGSIHEDIAVTKAIYDWFDQEGVKQVFHCGDMTEGCKMRAGQEHEIHKHGADDQVKWAVEQYPYIKGINTFLISGNHDAAHMKNGGSDVCLRMADLRDDISYLGMDEARFVVNRNGQDRDIAIDLLHPGGGSSYALSYKPQKIIEQLESGNKPDILLIGHFHKAFTLPAYRGVAAILTGCTQRQTGFMKRMGLAAHVGAHIVECRVLDGQVVITTSWRGFY